MVACLDCAVLIGRDCPRLQCLLKRKSVTSSCSKVEGRQATEKWGDLPLRKRDLAYLTKADPSQCHAQENSGRQHAFTLTDGLPFWWMEGRSQPVVTVPVRKKVLRLAHDPPLARHLVAEKMLNRILQQFYWPGIKVQVQ